MLGNHSSSLPQIATNASLSLANLWRTNAFLVHNLLLHYCISGVLIMMFFCDMCYGAFICLVLLVNGFPSLPFLYTWFFFHIPAPDLHIRPTLVITWIIHYGLPIKNSHFLMLAPFCRALYHLLSMCISMH